MTHYHSINIVYIPSNTLFWSILKSNKLVVGKSKAFVKGKGISLEGHKHSAGDITSGTLPVARGGTGVTSLDALKSSLGISGSGTSFDLSGAAIGNMVWFNNDNWLCVHRDNSAKLLYLIKYECVKNMAFGTNTTYKGSSIAQECLTYQNSMAADSLALCQNWTSEGVTQKVNLITKAQAEGGFKWFTIKNNRIAPFNNTEQVWWTSSPYGSGSVWCVYTDGSLDGGYPGGATGFRPCVAIKI